MNSDFWEEQVSVLVREIIANCEPLIFDLLEAAQDIETHALKLKSEVEKLHSHQRNDVTGAMLVEVAELVEIAKRMVAAKSDKERTVIRDAVTPALLRMCKLYSPHVTEADLYETSFFQKVRERHPQLASSASDPSAFRKLSVAATKSSKGKSDKDKDNKSAKSSGSGSDTSLGPYSPSEAKSSPISVMKARSGLLSNNRKNSHSGGSGPSVSFTSSSPIVTSAPPITLNMVTTPEKESPSPSRGMQPSLSSGNLTASTVHAGARNSHNFGNLSGGNSTASGQPILQLQPNFQSSSGGGGGGGGQLKESTSTGNLSVSSGNPSASAMPPMPTIPIDRPNGGLITLAPVLNATYSQSDKAANFLDYLHEIDPNAATSHNEVEVSCSEHETELSEQENVRAGQMKRTVTKRNTEIPPKPRTIDFSIPDIIDDNIIFMSEERSQVVKAATFSKLIEKLTCLETSYIDVEDFLFSYRLFATADEVIPALATRFTTTEDADKGVAMRIFNVFRRWIEKFWHDFSVEPSNSVKVLEFVDTILKSEVYSTNSAYVSVAKMLKQKIETKQRETADDAAIPAEWHLADAVVPRPVGAGVVLGLLEYSPVEFANNLSHIEWGMWVSIRESELIGLGWTKKNKEEIAPNVVNMTKWFNMVSNWVATCICTEENFKKRVKLISRFVEIADCLRNMGNYNGVLEIFSAFQRGPVARLTKSFAALEPKFEKIYSELLTLTNNNKNYTVLRQAVAQINPPVLPYLGMYLTDILFAIEGNPPYIGGLINFNRCRLYTSNIKRIKQYQLLSFHIQEKGWVIPHLQEAMNNLPSLNEDDLYTISQFIEPREGKEPGPRPDGLLEGFNEQVKNLHYLSTASSDKDIKRFVSKQRKESTAAMHSGAELARKVVSRGGGEATGIADENSEGGERSSHKSKSSKKERDSDQKSFKLRGVGGSEEKESKSQASKKGAHVPVNSLTEQLILSEESTSSDFMATASTSKLLSIIEKQKEQIEKLQESQALFQQQLFENQSQFQQKLDRMEDLQNLMFNSQIELLAKIDALTNGLEAQGFKK